MKLYYEYNRPCLNCYNIGDEENECANCKHNLNYLYIAVNEKETHIFNNKNQFHNFIKDNFGKYKVILPNNYFIKKELKNNYKKGE